MNMPKKWTEVYPQGTKQGDEESKFFRALARNPKYEYRSIAQLVKETGLTRERVEEIIEKYSDKIDPPLIYAHETNSDSWGYWERIPEVLKKDERSISEKDQDGRIKKHINGSEYGDACDGKCKNCGCHEGFSQIQQGDITLTITLPPSCFDFPKVPELSISDIQISPFTIALSDQLPPWNSDPGN